MQDATTHDELETPPEPPALPEEPSVGLVQSDGEVDLFNVLLLIAHHKRLMLRWTLGGAVLVLLGSLLLPSYYTGMSRVMPPHAAPSAAMALLGSLGMQGNLMPMDLGLGDSNDIYIAMLRSRSVGEMLIRRFDLQTVYGTTSMDAALTELAKHTNAESTKTGLIEVRYEDKSPQRAAEIANAYVETLRQVSQRLAVTEAAQRRLFFEQQLKQAKDDLANAEVAMKEGQEKSGVIELDEQSRALIRALAATRGEIAAAEVELSGMAAFATPDNPDLIRKRKELEAMRAQLDRLQRSTSAQKYDLAVGKLPQQGLEYVRRLRDVKYYETIFEIIAKQYEAAKIDEGKDSTVIQVLDTATVPERRSRPFARRYFALLGLLGGFALGLGQLMGREFLKANPEQRLRLELLRSAVWRRP